MKGGGWAVMAYYDRTASVNSDGTPLFANDYDKTKEDEFCQILADKWGCDINPFGRLCPIDFYAVKHGRLVAVLELKSRTHNIDKYPDVFLNVRKWLALTMASVGLGVPGVFSVRWADGNISWIDVALVSGGVRMAGCTMIVKSKSDIEPCFCVPVSEMRRIK